jgi:hypothetical protein
MPIVLLLAALIVVVTSAWIVIDGVGRGVPNTLNSVPFVAVTVASPEAHAAQGEALANSAAGAAGLAYMTGSEAATPWGPESERPAAETGFNGHCGIRSIAVRANLRTSPTGAAI